MSELDNYQNKIEFLLDNWNAEFDKFEARIGKSGADPESEYDGVISALRQHRHKATSIIEGIKQHGKDQR
jgi:hypothetical protein